MRRKEDWARPEWRKKVAKAVERASVERDSSEELFESAEREFAKLRELLFSAEAGAAAILREEQVLPTSH